MQSGSIVVIKNLNRLRYEACLHDIIFNWLPTDDEETPYTIKEVISDPEYQKGELFVTFIEGTLGYSDLGIEMDISIRYCIEILPPEEIDIECIMLQPEYTS